MNDFIGKNSKILKFSFKCIAISEKLHYYQSENANIVPQKMGKYESDGFQKM